MNNITINIENFSEEDKAIFNNLIRKYGVYKNIWVPVMGSEYYSSYNAPHGELKHFIWENNDLDRYLYSIGDCHPTKEDAEFAREKRKLEFEIRKYIEDNDKEILDWNNFYTSKYYISYNYLTNKITRNCGKNMKCQGTIYFSKMLDFDAMIGVIGEDRIRKYMFKM